MNPTFKRFFTRSVMTLLGAVVVSAARAQFVPISSPDASYLAGTTKIDITDPDFTALSSISDATLTVGFDIDLVALTVPGTWATWGAPPDTESATPRVLWTGGFTEVTLTFSQPLSMFGLEAQPNPAIVSPITATFFDGVSVVGTITRDVNGNGGARLFAASFPAPLFTSVVLSSPDDFAIAQLRYNAPGTPVVPEPGTTALLIGAGAGGGCVLLRRRNKRGVKE